VQSQQAFDGVQREVARYAARTEKLSNQLQIRAQELVAARQTGYLTELELEAQKRDAQSAQNMVAVHLKTIQGLENALESQKLKNSALIAVRQELSFKEKELASLKDEREDMRTKLQVEGDELLAAKMSLAIQQENTRKAQNAIQAHLKTIQRLEAALACGQMNQDALMTAKQTISLMEIELATQQKNEQALQHIVQTHLKTIQRLETALASEQLKNRQLTEAQAAQLAHTQQAAQAAHQMAQRWRISVHR